MISQSHHFEIPCTFSVVQFLLRFRSLLFTKNITLRCQYNASATSFLSQNKFTQSMVIQAFQKATLVQVHMMRDIRSGFFSSLDVIKKVVQSYSFLSFIISVSTGKKPYDFTSLFSQYSTCELVQLVSVFLHIENLDGAPHLLVFLPKSFFSLTTHI